MLYVRHVKEVFPWSVVGGCSFEYTVCMRAGWNSTPDATLAALFLVGNFDLVANAEYRFNERL